MVSAHDVDGVIISYRLSGIVNVCYPGVLDIVTRVYYLQESSLLYIHAFII
jgi:hypothetical protein